LITVVSIRTAGLLSKALNVVPAVHTTGCRTLWPSRCYGDCNDRVPSDSHGCCIVFHLIDLQGTLPSWSLIGPWLPWLHQRSAEVQQHASTNKGRRNNSMSVLEHCRTAVPHVPYMQCVRFNHRLDTVAVHSTVLVQLSSRTYNSCNSIQPVT
jgi:hypothetical protein